MDIHCPKCGEPWDNDTLHEAAEEQDSTYQKVAKDFRARGCAAIGWGTCTSGTNDDQADRARMVYDLLGDDMDGAASILSEYL